MILALYLNISYQELCTFSEQPSLIQSISLIFSPQCGSCYGSFVSYKDCSCMNLASVFHLHCNLPYFIEESWSANFQLLSRPCAFWNISWHMAKYWKYWQFYFKYYFSFLAKNIHCLHELCLQFLHKLITQIKIGDVGSHKLWVIYYFSAQHGLCDGACNHCAWLWLQGYA
jgi:hypothetical protein